MINSPEFKVTFRKLRESQKRRAEAQRTWEIRNGYGPKFWLRLAYLTDNRPERLREQGSFFGYRYVIVAHAMGWLCGYIELPHNHPWVATYKAREKSRPRIQAHNGITFMGRSERHHGKRRPWWIGFDCGHAGDAPNPEWYDDQARASEAMLNERGLSNPMIKYGTYRDENYVRGWLYKIGAQAALGQGKISVEAYEQVPYPHAEGDQPLPYSVFDIFCGAMKRYESA